MEAYGQDEGEVNIYKHDQTRKLKKERGHDPGISSSCPSRVEELESINIRSLGSSLRENEMEVKLTNVLNVIR